MDGRFRRSITPIGAKIMVLRAVLFVLVHMAIVGAVLSLGSDDMQATALVLASR